MIVHGDGVQPMTYYNAEDDLWFDCVPRIWFDGDRCKVTVTGYRVDDGAWITVRRPLAVAGIPVIDTGMPIVVTESSLRGKLVNGGLA